MALCRRPVKRLTGKGEVSARLPTSRTVSPDFRRPSLAFRSMIRRVHSRRGGLPPWPGLRHRSPAAAHIQDAEEFAAAAAFRVSSVIRRKTNSVSGDRTAEGPPRRPSSGRPWFPLFFIHGIFSRRSAWGLTPGEGQFNERRLIAGRLIRRRRPSGAMPASGEMSGLALTSRT